MLLLLMSVFCIVPLALGFTIVLMFGRTTLSRHLFLFLMFLSVWQLDIAVLYAVDYLPGGAVDAGFRLLRFGSILLIPLMYSCLQSIRHDTSGRPGRIRDKRWTHWPMIALYAWCALLYAAGWTRWGVERLELVELPGTPAYYFPVYGPLQLMLLANGVLLILLLVGVISTTRQIQNVQQRSFFRWFTFSLAFVYIIGSINWPRDLGMLVGSVAVLLFAIIVFVQFSRIHTLRMKEINTELRDKRQMLRNVIDMNPNHIYAVNEEGYITLANRSFADFNGVSIRQIIGMPARDVIRSSELTFDWLAATVEGQDSGYGRRGNPVKTEDIVLTPHGEERAMQTVKLPVNFSGVPQWLCISVDITERKQYERAIMRMAYHDSLTSLPNRLMFKEQLERMLNDRGNQSIGLLFLDLDRFKWVNDTAGHTTGDRLLQQVAQRLTDSCPSDSLVCRLGGDEFIVLISPCDRQLGQETAASILKAMEDPFRLADQDFQITSSIGIAIYPHDGLDADTLVKHADSAMYEAKERGKNGYMFFNNDLNSRLTRKLEIEAALRRAVEAGQVSLHYQPQIRLVDGSCIGMEALMRWRHPELGQVPPSEFIAIAEENGLILPIGRWVLQEACRQMGEWQQAGIAPRRIAVNLSLRQLHDPTLAEWISHLLAEYGLAPGSLELEVTESTAMSDGELVVLRMRELKQIGVSLSIDDFGTGYASLSHLSQFPLDRLKIDRSFIQELTNGANRAAIVAAIVSLANHLQLETVAEGVESETQAELLKQIGCKEAQGFRFSRPLPAAAATAWLADEAAAGGAAAARGPEGSGGS